MTEDNVADTAQAETSVTQAEEKKADTVSKPKNAHKGQENLIPLNRRSKDAQREIQSMGGKAASKKAKEKKALREKLEVAMSMPLRSGRVTSIDAVKNFEDAKDANMTLEDRMIMQIARKAANGDPQIYMLYREELGQRPADRIEATVTLIDHSKLSKMKKLIDQHPELLEEIAKNGLD